MRNLEHLDNASLGALSVALNGYQEHQTSNPYVSSQFLDIVELLAGSVRELNVWGIRDLITKENKRRIRDVTVKVVSPASYELIQKLGNQERNILRLIGRGQTNQSIARLLTLSVRTVANHKNKIYKKLDLSSASDLTKFCIDNLEIL